jgi:TRAP transporter TAXI family solute receptor
MKTIKTTFLVVSALLAICTATTTAIAQNKILRADATNPAGSSAILFTVLGKIYAREIGVSLQINTGQTLTRSVLKFGTDDLEMVHMVPQIVPWLKNGKKMYKKKLQKQAKKAYANTRALFGFPASAIHIVAWHDSDIKTLADIKGKVVYMGPPAGGFWTQSTSYIKAVTGLTPKDFKTVRLPWGQGMQAMLDGQIDVFFRPTAIGSAVINQVGAKKKFVLLGAGKAADTKQWNNVMIKRLKNGNITIPANTYQNQVGGDVRTSVANNSILVRANMDSQLVYNMVKAVWENIDEIHKSAAALRPLSKNKPFTGVNLPLHPGAVKYYKEMGLQIPADILPQ